VAEELRFITALHKGVADATTFGLSAPRGKTVAARETVWGTGPTQVGKLVRDKIPDIINASGRAPEVRRLDECTYVQALHEKLADWLKRLQNYAALTAATTCWRRPPTCLKLCAASRRCTDTHSMTSSA
jgi:hypothetical protein